MKSNARNPETSLLRLSRIGAVSTLTDLELEAALACPSGPGIRLSSRCGEAELSLWISEASWCTWLAPEIMAPSLDQIDETLYPLLASWTLAPLDEWLQAQRLPALAQAKLARDEAPPLCWRLTLSRAGLSLPLYLDDVPEELLDLWLSALSPNPARQHDFNLQLGWCQLPEARLSDLVLGEALPLNGLEEAPDRFWLYPLAGGVQLQLLAADLAQVVPASPLLPPPEGTVRLRVEAGSIRLDAVTLADWSPGLEFTPQVHAYPGLRLMRDDRLWAEGTLLRLDDGWAVRLTTQPQHESMP
ncbi:hypothetical protein [Aeromonas jandaei]